MSSCFGCSKLFSLAKDIKVTDAIASLIAFSPPSKINYTIENKGDINKRGKCYREVKFIHDDYNEINYPWIEITCHRIKKCSNNKHIIALHIKNNNMSKEKKLTIIFSHGNSCDLGKIYPFLIDLSTQLKADVISYDYSGYGRSEGSPSEKEIYSDIDQIMDFVMVFKRIKLDSIVLMGNSLGSVPSVYIAAGDNYKGIKGVILISPIASGIKLFHPNVEISNNDLEKIDVFCNLSKVREINCPVFLIHGKKDDIIPHNQSIEMLKKIKHVYEWFPSNGNHNNITSKYRAKFYLKVKLFIEFLEYNKQNKRRKKELFNDPIQDSNGPSSRNMINIYTRTKQIKCEENYIKTEGNYDNYNDTDNKKSKNPSSIKIIIPFEENGSSNIKDIKQSPQINCISVSNKNIFELTNNNNSSQFNTQSVENEGEYIFNTERTSDCFYNYSDAKELEMQFNQLQKNVN